MIDKKIYKYKINIIIDSKYKSISFDYLKKKNQFYQFYRIPLIIEKNKIGDSFNLTIQIIFST